jgi:hypothetical protein
MGLYTLERDGECFFVYFVYTEVECRPLISDSGREEREREKERDEESESESVSMRRTDGHGGRERVCVCERERIFLDVRKQVFRGHCSVELLS